jgi:hypothetical protein
LLLSLPFLVKPANQTIYTAESLVDLAKRTGWQFITQPMVYQQLKKSRAAVHSFVSVLQTQEPQVASLAIFSLA